MFNEILGWWRWWRWCFWCWRASPCWSRYGACCRWRWAGLRGRRSCSSMNSRSWTPGCTWDFRCWHWLVLWWQNDKDHDDQDTNCWGRPWCWWPCGQHDYYNDNNMIKATTTWLQWQQYDYSDDNMRTTRAATIWSQSQHLLRLHRHLSVHLNGRELDGNGQTSSSCIYCGHDDYHDD